MNQSMTRLRSVPASAAPRTANRASQSPTAPSRGRLSPIRAASPSANRGVTPTAHRSLVSLLTQLRTDYAQQAIDLRTQHLAPHRLQLELYSRVGFSPLIAPAIGQHLAQTLQQQRATLLANQIRQIDLLLTVPTASQQEPHPQRQRLWQTTIALAPPTTPSPLRHRAPGKSSPVLPLDSAPPIVKLGRWVMLGCLDFLQSNAWLLTFLLSGWLYAAIALNPAPQTTPPPPQTTQPIAQPASIPLPDSVASPPANRPTPAPLDVAVKPNPLTFTVPEVFQGKTISRINPIRARKVIALTFSNGPWPDNTEAILAILKRYHVKATFFWGGQAVADQPDLACQVVAHGHAIGYQPWSRPDSPSQRFAIAQEIQRTAQVIQQTTGVTSTLFRPSQNPVNEALLLQAQRQQYTTILWSVDAGNEDSSDAIVDRVLQDASSGAIVRMQDGGGDRVALIQALPQIITLLRRQGYQFLTIPDLLEQQTNLQTRPI